MAMRDHAAVPRREAKARAHAAKELAVDTAAAIRAADILPPVASTAGGYTLGELVGMFKRSVEVVEKVLAHAHDEEGKVRLVKTALQASAQLQHSALAYAKLLEASTNATNMQAFIGEMIALLERVGRRHREAGHDIALGLQAITAKWRA